MATATSEFVPIEGHPGFYRRGGRVYFRFRDHRRRQRWRSARTLKLARAARAAAETDVDRGEYRPQASTSFKAYATSWIETYQGRTSSRIDESTRKRYRRPLEQEAIPFFGDTPLAAITPQLVKAYIAHVAKRRRRGKRWEKDRSPVSANTVRLALAPVKALLADAFEEGAIRVNPAAGVRLIVPRDEIDPEDLEAARDVKALSPDELKALLKAVSADERWAGWRLLLVVLVHLGLRIGEAIELRWDDVDLGQRTVRIRRKFYDGRVGPPKSRFGRRTLRLTPELARALWQLRKDERRAGRGRDRDLVFVAAKGGRINPSNLMARMLKPAGRKAGVEWVGFHTLRHTCATALFRDGWNAKQVQLWLGHHKASFTIDTYVHLLEEDMPEPPRLASVTQDVTQSTPSEAITEAAGPQANHG